MSNYSVIAGWGSKDALPTGTPTKLVSATELGLEFSAIATMSATKEDGVNKGAASGYAGLDSGTRLLAANFPAFTGDVTNTAGTIAMSIAASAVTNAKLANMPTLTLKGNNTGGSAAPQDLTVTQLNAMLGISSGGLALVKPADTARASNIVMSNDPDLQVTLGVGTYLIDVVLRWDAGGVAGINLIVGVFHSGTILENQAAVLFTGTGTSKINIGAINPAANVNAVNDVSSGAGAGSMIYSSFVMTVTASGTFSIKWCQQITNATPVTLRAGSCVRYQKIA